MRTQRHRAIRLLLILLALAACDGGEGRRFAHGASLTGGDPYEGRKLARDYGCGSCHTIPGVPGADALVGPPLADMGSRMYIAGRLTNTPQHMIRWIQDPQAIDSGTAMPNVGVSERDARDIAAYLYAIGARRVP